MTLPSFQNLVLNCSITVIADAGMLSARNLQALASAGYSYIVGSRLNKTPYGIAEYQKVKELTDNQIITSKLDGNQRIVYQYRTKRAALDLRNIEKQIEKAKRIVNGTTTAKRAKFLTITTKNKQLNQTLIKKLMLLPVSKVMLPISILPMNKSLLTTISFGTWKLVSE